MFSIQYTVYLRFGFNEKDAHRLFEKIGSPSGADDLDCNSGWLVGPNNVHVPFLACGDLSGYDSDRSYPLPKVADGSCQSLDPVQPPIAPPYKPAQYALRNLVGQVGILWLAAEVNKTKDIRSKGKRRVGWGGVAWRGVAWGLIRNTMDWYNFKGQKGGRLR
ncbi:tRNA (cytidine(32) guanosine(34)-2 -O)-methyltransferase [Olea europaea subsp. europaea]|uniref:tRNA (Cytidine(32) guanosine(34)-2 -O)-methyltransferase n=1 Tax=Olea europaea subsp. europaea TaxID=158383 RepID=A0A8S0PK38_OLEEU|nr:tRNA (cytidine(32) guanosine(34)-2 -O)-methyltransferase [Olea europaea subsp. europaea]